jgi:hypothetical protein
MRPSESPSQDLWVLYTKEGMGCQF